MEAKKTIPYSFTRAYTYMNKMLKVWKDTQKTFKSRQLSLENDLGFGESGKNYDLALYIFFVVCVFNENIFSIYL